jgi:hypothetical protein
MNITFQNKSATDLSAAYGSAVKFDTDGIALCSAITDQAIGVVTKGGTTECDVCVQGECFAKLGGALTKGKMVIPHTDGTVKNTAASSQEFALALETGVAGDLVRIHVIGSPKTQS